jgi:hypothetical protein
MRCRQPFHPLAQRHDQAFKLIDLRREGKTLRQAAAAVGVHVSTICRWQARCEALREALVTAHYAFRRQRLEAMPKPRRPRVPVHPLCPCCGNGVVVRTFRLWCGIRFWCCSRGPRYCGWRSWLPRHPADCGACGGARFWSHSRKSVSCRRCKRRWPAGEA